MIRIALAAFALLAALAASPALGQQAAATRHATELRDAPGETGASIASLPAQASVMRTGERRGAWVQVRTAAGASGWVHLFDLGPPAASTSASATEGARAVSTALRGVTELLGGARPAQAGTTAGIRGLGAADLARAQPDPYEVARMEKLRQDEAQARGFAEAAGLHAVTVAPLPSPVPAVSTPGRPAKEPQLP